MYEVAFSVRVEMFLDSSRTSRQRPVYTKQAEYMATVNVVDQDPVGLIALVSSPELDSAVAAMISIADAQFVPYGDPSGACALFIYVAIAKPRPVGIGFEAFIESDGVRSPPLGLFSCAEGSVGAEAWTFRTQLAAPPSGPIAVVLRRSVEAAANSVDVYEIWAGDLRFDDITVRRGE